MYVQYDCHRPSTFRDLLRKRSARQHGLPNISHVKMNNGRKGGHFKFDQVNFFQDASSSEISHFVLQ